MLRNILFVLFYELKEAYKLFYLEFLIKKAEIKGLKIKKEKGMYNIIDENDNVLFKYREIKNVNKFINMYKE